MTAPFPDPTLRVQSRPDVFDAYLDYFRDRILSKVEALPAAELRRSRLPSGWTPLELLNHLTWVERRWLEWGFRGRELPDPWGDRQDGRWHVTADESLDDLVAALRAQAAFSRSVIAHHDLAEIGRPGPRWDGAAPPTLERILMHLVQEYARHLGHLDVVAELTHGSVGE